MTSSIGAQIVWPDPDVQGKGSAGAAAAGGGGRTKANHGAWGARFQGNLGAEGEVKSLLSIEDSGAAPQAIGVNLYRSDVQAVLANSDVRARVRWGAGRSGQLSFDCDWRGGFVVHATRIDVEYVTYKMPSVGVYVAATQVVLAATAGLNGSRPSHAPTLTYLPEVVATGASRSIAIPLMARRVALLMRYADDPASIGITGDVPLGSTFVSFADATGAALAWIDASTTRASAFGEGLSIPAGAAYLGLSNDSAAATSLGAIFHLGL